MCNINIQHNHFQTRKHNYFHALLSLVIMECRRKKIRESLNATFGGWKVISIISESFDTWTNPQWILTVGGLNELSDNFELNEIGLWSVSFSSESTWTFCFEWTKITKAHRDVNTLFFTFSELYAGPLSASFKERLHAHLVQFKFK